MAKKLPREYNNLKIYIGVIEEVLDNYSIKFRIPDILDNLSEYPTAHPVSKHCNKMYKDEAVLIIQLDTDLQEFIYFPHDTSSVTSIQFEQSIVELTEDSVSIRVRSTKSPSEDKPIPEEDQVSSKVNLDKNGNIEIVSLSGGMEKSTISVTNNDIVVKHGDSAGEIKLDANGTNIKHTGGMEINMQPGNSTIGTSANMLMNSGVVVPSGSGPFCAVPVCPMSGSPHTGVMVQQGKITYM